MRTITKLQTLLVLFLTTAMVCFMGCKDDDDDKSDKTTNQWIESAMRSYYLWYEEIPDKKELNFNADPEIARLQTYQDHPVPRPGAARLERRTAAGGAGEIRPGAFRFRRTARGTAARTRFSGRDRKLSLRLPEPGRNHRKNARDRLRALHLRPPSCRERTVFRREGHVSLRAGPLRVAVLFRPDRT